MIVSTAVAQRRAFVVLAVTVALMGARFVTQSWAAGAFAMGKCGAHGQAYDYAGEGEATRECYKFGGKACVIRVRACDEGVTSRPRLR